MLRSGVDDSPRINPGKFVHSIEYQRSTATRGASGSVPPSWDETTPFATVDASIDPVSTREQMSALSEGMEITHRVTHWYVAGITASMRIKFGSRYFDVKGIRNLQERNMFQEVLCMEGRTRGS